MTVLDTLRARRDAAEVAWFRAWQAERLADPTAPTRGRLPETQAAYDALHEASEAVTRARGYVPIDVPVSDTSREGT